MSGAASSQAGAVSPLREMSVPASRKDPFIVSTSLEKPDAATRKFIRSQVMRGKNRGKNRGKTKRSSPDSTPASASSVSSASSKEGYYDKAVPHCEGVPSWDSQSDVWTPSLRKLVSELTLWDYHEDASLTALGPGTLDLLHKAFSFFRPTSFQVDLSLVDGLENGSISFHLFTRYPAMIHSFIFVMKSIADVQQGLAKRGPGAAESGHLSKTLYHLQRALSDFPQATADPTIFSVAALATGAAMYGDFETARKHMDGLHHIVALRGREESPAAVEKDKQLKIRRIDLAMVLATGEPTKFMLRNPSWNDHVSDYLQDPVDPTSLPALFKFPELAPLNRLTEPPFDPRLLHVWADLQEFCQRAELAAHTGRKISVDIYLFAVEVIPARLLELGGRTRQDGVFSAGTAPSLAELLRLSMFAALKTIYIHFPGLGQHLSFLQRGLKAALVPHSRPPLDEGLASLLLWALFMAGLAISDEPSSYDWLDELGVLVLRTLRTTTYVDAKRVLKKFPWIDKLHDQESRLLFLRWHQLAETPPSPRGKAA